MNTAMKVDPFHAVCCFLIVGLCGASIAQAQSDTLWKRFIENQFWKTYGVTADDSVVLAGDQDGRIYMFNAETGDLISDEFLCKPNIDGPAPTSNIIFSMSRSGGRITAKLDTIIRIYNYPGYELVRQISSSSLFGPKSRKDIGFATLSDDGDHYLAFRENHLQVRDVETDTLVIDLPNVYNFSRSPILSPDNRFVAFTDYDTDKNGNNVNATLHVFDVQVMAEVLKVNYGNNLIPSGLDFSLDGKYLAYCDVRDREASSEARSHVVIYDMDSLKSVDSSASTSLNTSSLRFIRTNQGYRYTKAYYNDSVTIRGMALMELGVDSILMDYPDRLGYFSLSGKVLVEIRGQYLWRRMVQVPSTVDERTQSDNFNLFPNPTASYCEFTGLKTTDRVMQWELISKEGAIIARGTTEVVDSRGHIQFTDSFAKGIYMLRLFRNGAIVKTSTIALYH